MTVFILLILNDGDFFKQNSNRIQWESMRIIIRRIRSSRTLVAGDYGTFSFSFSLRI